MEIKLREIAGKSAGQYFIVTDNSATSEIEETSNLRLFFINVEKSPVNTVVIFKKGDTSGFESVFGKQLRKHEKQGNFSVRECINALRVSNIAVMNLRAFTTVDKAGIIGLSPNKTLEESILKEYSKLYNTNGLWTIKAKNLPDLVITENLLNIANVGNSDVSTFVTIAKKASVDTLTSEGDKTLISTILEIEDFPALDADCTVRDTFVDVYVFDNTFDPLTVSTNRYYGNLFGVTGLISYDKLSALAAIPESGFNRKITGSLIPNLKNEFNEDISIDTKMNSVYAETNLISHINADLLELETIDSNPVINTNFQNYYNLTTGALKDTGNLMSHRLQDLSASIKNVDLAAIKDTDLASVDGVSFITYTGNVHPDVTKKNKVFGIFEHGLRIGSKVIDTATSKTLKVMDIEVVEESSIVDLAGGSSLPYKRVILTLSGLITGGSYTKVSDILGKSSVLSSSVQSYKPRAEQFTNGTASRQKEILDVMVSPGIVKGLKNFGKVRYIVDTFKSFIEGGYKSQFGQLCLSLDKSNKFVRAFVNEPFIEDLEKSLNPLFKQSPSNVFDISYIAQGGNPDFSTNFLTKPTSGSEMCFYFGSKLDGVTEVPTASEVSNAFVQKTFPWDVVANASGYLDTVDGLEFNPDDEERIALEKFRWNPIIKNHKGFTIFGNMTGQKANTSLSQIHNSELLAYIKESLYNMSRDEAFKKGTYNEYLATEIEVKSFMDNLALSGAIQANPIVICSAENNTTEIAKAKIKLIHVEYYAINALDKIVFTLDLK